PAVLPSSREAVRDGNAQQVTFTFSETGEVGLRAFVVPAESFFESWGPSEIPAAPGTSTEPSAESSDEPAPGSTDEAGTPDGAETSGTGDAPESGTATDACSASQSAGQKAPAQRAKGGPHPGPALLRPAGCSRRTAGTRAGRRTPFGNAQHHPRPTAGSRAAGAMGVPPLERSREW